jgi:hypothetical protein
MKRETMDLVLNAEQAKALRAELVSCMEAHTRVNLDLSKLLFKVYYATVRQGNADVPLVVSWGHEDFDEFAEHELGLHQTTARSHVTLYEELVHRREFPPKSLPNSITKLRVLTKICKVPGITDQQIRAWAAKAKDMSCCELQHEYDEKYLNKQGTHPVRFSVPSGSYKSFLKKLEKAREAFETNSNGEAMNKVLEDFVGRYTAEQARKAG